MKTTYPLIALAVICLAARTSAAETNIPPTTTSAVKVTIHGTTYTVPELRSKPIAELKDIIKAGEGDRDRIAAGIDLSTNVPPTAASNATNRIKEPRHLVLKEIFKQTIYYTTNNYMELAELQERPLKIVREKESLLAEIKYFENKYEVTKAYYEYFAKVEYKPQVPLVKATVKLRNELLGEVLNVRYDLETAITRLIKLIKKQVLLVDDPKAGQKKAILDIIEVSSKFTTDDIPALDSKTPEELEALKAKDLLIADIFDLEKSVKAERMLLLYLTEMWQKK